MMRLQPRYAVRRTVDVWDFCGKGDGEKGGVGAGRAEGGIDEVEGNLEEVERQERELTEQKEM